MPATETLTLAGHEVDALSIGGIETCIHLPRLRLAFDIGRCPESVVARDTILFTHAHMDHMAGVAWHCATRALRGMGPPTYVVPRENAEDFERMFEAWRALDQSDLEHRTVALAPGEEFELGRNLVARPFRSPHTAPCQGYSVWGRRHKLRPEYAGLPGEKIRDLRAEGVQVTDTLEVAEVAFTGDTRIDVLEQEAVVREARLLVMEVTMLDDRVSVEKCRRHGHVHLDEVVEKAELFRNEAILFTHFSARYRAHEIRKILDRRLPAELRERVTPLVRGFA